MALATYSDLETAVANWLAKSTLTSFIPDLIALGEKRVFDELRVREMKTALSAVMASGLVSVPSDWLAFDTVYIDGSPTQLLTPTTMEQLLGQYSSRSSDGKPSVIAEDGANFQFGPFPDSNYTVKGTYYARPLALSGSQATNTIFPTYSDLYLWAALAEAEPFVKNDARMQLWEGKYQTALERVNSRDKKARLSGGLLRPRPG